MERRVAVAVGGVTPPNGFSVIVGKESVDPIVRDEARGMETTLSLSLVCKMIEGTITVRPVRIVRERNAIEEQQEIVSQRWR